jgi:hypothetical protein
MFSGIIFGVLSVLIALLLLMHVYIPHQRINTVQVGLLAIWIALGVYIFG